ncbi:MAG: TolC family protein [Bacteriovoracaceae bacterium]|nr:TolC family protein [Bacteriovoracaceae bacterium]
MLNLFIRYSQRRSMRAVVLIVLSLYGQVGHTGMQLEYENLENLIRTKNKNVAATNFELSGVDKRLGFLRRSFIPTGEAWVGQEKFETGPYESMNEPLYSLRANINLYRGGRDALEETARTAQKRGMEARALQVFQGELFEVRALYWDLVFFKEIEGLYTNALKQNENNLSKALRRINSGLATKVDKLEFEISETQLKQDLARIAVSISITQRKIAALLGHEPETQFDTIVLIPHDHNDTTPSQTMDFNLFRDVQLELANKVDFEAQGKILKRWWTPKVDLYAETILYNFRERSFYTQNDQIDNALGIRLTFNFDGFQAQYDGEAMIAKSHAAQFRAEQTKIEAEADFNTAKQELILIHDLIHEGEKNVEKGAQYLSQTQEEYSRGVKNSPDVLSATFKQLEFKKRFAELRRDYAIAKAQLQSILASEL